MIEQGDVYWLNGLVEGELGNGIAHPHVVLQDTAINASRIDTVVVCAVSTNLARAYDKGNVLLGEGEGGLARPSFVAVGQISAVKKDDLGKKIGKLDPERVAEILAGVKLRAQLP